MSSLTFNYFPSLPAEIRLAIWRYAFPSTSGIISLYDWRWSELALYPRNIPVCHGRELRPDRKVQVTQPAAFFVNRESRDVAQEWALREGLEGQSPWAVTTEETGDVGGPTKMVLTRGFDRERDYVYLGWERKADFKEWTLEWLDDPDPPPAPYRTMAQMRHFVVPAFTGYYSTDLLVDVLKNQQVEKLYIMWGKLPQPSYAVDTRPKDHVTRQQYFELDVQPCWRLEEIPMTEEGDEDDEVEMYSYVSKARGRDPRPGDETDLYIEKGSLSEWMEELCEQLIGYAEEDGFGREPDGAKFLETLQIVPVRLVQDGFESGGQVQIVDGEAQTGVTISKGACYEPR